MLQRHAQPFGRRRQEDGGRQEAGLAIGASALFPVRAMGPWFPVISADISKAAVGQSVGFAERIGGPGSLDRLVAEPKRHEHHGAEDAQHVHRSGVP